MKMKNDLMIEELRELMKERKLSSYAAGRILGIAARTIERWLAYENNPSPVYRKVIKIGIRRIKKMGLD